MTYFKNVKYKILVTLDDYGRRGGIGWLDINTLWRDAGGVLCRAALAGRGMRVASTVG